MPISAGRVGVRSSQVDSYGRLKLTDELTDAIVTAVCSKLGIEFDEASSTYEFVEIVEESEEVGG